MFWKHWHTVFPKPHISPWPYSCLMELAFIEKLHGKARSVAWLRAFCFQVSHHGWATSNGFKLNYEMPFLNWTMRCFFKLLYVFHMCLYSYYIDIYIYKFIYFSVKVSRKNCGTACTRFVYGFWAFHIPT